MDKDFQFINTWVRIKSIITDNANEILPKVFSDLYFHLMLFVFTIYCFPLFVFIPFCSKLMLIIIIIVKVLSPTYDCILS